MIRYRIKQKKNRFYPQHCGFKTLWMWEYYIRFNTKTEWVFNNLERANEFIETKKSEETQIHKC